MIIKLSFTQPFAGRRRPRRPRFPNSMLPFCFYLRCLLTMHEDHRRKLERPQRVKGGNEGLKDPGRRGRRTSTVEVLKSPGAGPLLLLLNLTFPPLIPNPKPFSCVRINFTFHFKIGSVLIVRIELCFIKSIS